MRSRVLAMDDFELVARRGFWPKKRDKNAENPRVRKFSGAAVARSVQFRPTSKDGRIDAKAGRGQDPAGIDVGTPSTPSRASRMAMVTCFSRFAPSALRGSDVDEAKRVDVHEAAIGQLETGNDR